VHIVSQDGAHWTLGGVEARSWSFIDALILASAVLIQEAEDDDLAALIGTADYIDRIVLGREEIESAVNALAACALLDTSEPLVPTDTARSMWVAAADGRGMVEAVKNLLARLNKAATEPQRHDRWLLSQTEYEAAVREYRRRFAAAWKRLDEGPGSRA